MSIEFTFQQWGYRSFYSASLYVFIIFNIFFSDYAYALFICKSGKYVSQKSLPCVVLIQLTKNDAVCVLEGRSKAQLLHLNDHQSQTMRDRAAGDFYLFLSLPVSVSSSPSPVTNLQATISLRLNTRCFAVNSQRRYS